MTFSRRRSHKEVTSVPTLNIPDYLFVFIEKNQTTVKQKSKYNSLLLKAF